MKWKNAPLRVEHGVRPERKDCLSLCFSLDCELDMAEVPTGPGREDNPCVSLPFATVFSTYSFSHHLTLAIHHHSESSQQGEWAHRCCYIRLS